MTATTIPARRPRATPTAAAGARRGVGLAPRQFAELSAALDQERRSLQAQISAYREAQQHLGMAQHEEGGPGNAPGDVASDLAQEELVVALERADASRLAMVERAQARVATETYGLCERCGLPIGYPRLRALPWTPLCRACAGPVRRRAPRSRPPGRDG
jgi:RNA polymerase-binding transcription factor DksA